MKEESEPAGGIPTWTLGWRLKRALAWAGVGVQEMADELGYSRSQLSRWMNDKGEAPRRTVLAQWSMRCGVPLDWLAYGIGDDGTDDPGGQEIAASRCTVLQFQAA